MYPVTGNDRPGGVIPVKTGIQFFEFGMQLWIPAFAGMTFAGVKS